MAARFVDVRVSHAKAHCWKNFAEPSLTNTFVADHIVQGPLFGAIPLAKQLMSVKQSHAVLQPNSLNSEILSSYGTWDLFLGRRTSILPLSRSPSPF
jgi:hypothetical protein